MGVLMAGAAGLPHRVSGMARRVGVDLDASVYAGALSAGTRDTMAARCAACPHTGACSVWLSGALGRMPGVPEYCPNAAVLERLGGR